LKIFASFATFIKSLYHIQPAFVKEMTMFSLFYMLKLILKVNSIVEFEMEFTLGINDLYADTIDFGSADAVNAHFCS